MNPVIAKVEANSDPIIWIAFSSDRHTTAQLTDYVDRFVIDQIKRIDGVADAIIFAERRYAMRIWLDAMSMAAHNITTQDVEDALERQNQEIPGGRVQSREREFTVRNESDLRTVAQFNDLIIRGRRRLPPAYPRCRACGAGCRGRPPGRSLQRHRRGGDRRRAPVGSPTPCRSPRSCASSCRRFKAACQTACRSTWPTTVRSLSMRRSTTSTQPWSRRRRWFSR